MSTTNLQLLSQAKQSSKAADKGVKPLDSAELLSNIIVIKLSGKLVDEQGMLASLAKDISAAVKKGAKVVLVHGGGKQINQALSEAKIQTMVENGIRVTPPKAMPTIARVIGRINGEIARELKESVTVSQAGIEGTSPVVYGGQAEGDKSCTGSVKEVDEIILKYLLWKSDVVVLSCLARVGDSDNDYGFLNVNADDVANAVAVAIGAKKLIALSDKPVLGEGGRPLALLDKAGAEQLISSGVISQGMVPKVNNMLAAAEHIAEVIVAGEGASLAGLLSGTCEGATRFLFK